ncbi:endolytic transglycosylase MltG [Dysgonomonas sp. ZJ279]|uniref:endolytic transglycosylase MltG n=1 Tax=Dysgonomonas sp. ZJ279 TaxID=2709796 RepID=UPI0013ECD355|nr:endolytic transglycosylase MltG [Dysgonomonas sp. ZJ279]
MKKKIGIVIGVLLLIGIAVAGYVYSIISTGFNIKETVYVYVDSRKDYNALLEELESTTKVQSIGSFEKVASFLDYKTAMRTGKYAVTPDMTVLDLVRNLRNGHQVPVKIKFNNIRTKEDLTERISEQLMFTNDELLSILNDEKICADLGFNPQTIIAMFIPNTYEFYWDVKVDAFLAKMNKEYQKFWTQERLNKAKGIGLSPIEVSTLASIVEEECTYSDEYPMVAGLYLNRLHRGQALQADPTVKFAVGDFSLRRILNKHLEVNSPYNTYLNTGLPPGPIRVPSIKGIDGVLNYSKHNYLYMCAKDDFSGRHNFAVTFGEHQQNANKYRQALNARSIY